MALEPFNVILLYNLFPPLLFVYRYFMIICVLKRVAHTHVAANFIDGPSKSWRIVPGGMSRIQSLTQSDEFYASKTLHLSIFDAPIEFVLARDATHWISHSLVCVHAEFAGALQEVARRPQLRVWVYVLACVYCPLNIHARSARAHTHHTRPAPRAENSSAKSQLGEICAEKLASGASFAREDHRAPFATSTQVHFIAACLGQKLRAKTLSVNDVIAPTVK